MGVKVETRCLGFAASAAFLIFSAGHDRVASPTAEFMWHECRSWAFFDEKNPSKLEDEARIFRHLQDTANKYLAGVSKVLVTERSPEKGKGAAHFLQNLESEVFSPSHLGQMTSFIFLSS